MARYVDKFQIEDDEILIKDSKALSQIELINSEYIVVIGDSYAQGWNGSQALTGWPYKMAEYLGYTINTNLFIKAEGGSGFYAGGNTTGSNFKDLLETLSNEMTEEQRNKVKIVLVGGGHNDTYDGSTRQNIQSNIKDFVLKQKQLYPNAKTHIAFIGRTNNINVYRKVNVVLPAYQTCAQSGACYVRNSENIIYNKSWITDGIHLNQNGYDYLGLQMANYILNKNIDVQEFSTINFTNLAEVSTINMGAEGRIFYSNDNTYILDDQIRIHFINNIELRWDNYTAIMGYNSDILKSPAFGVFTNCYALAQNTNNVWIWLPVTLQYQTGGTVSAKLANPSGGLSMTIKDINIMGIYSIFNLPNTWI